MAACHANWFDGPTTNSSRAWRGLRMGWSGAAEAHAAFGVGAAGLGSSSLASGDCTAAARMISSTSRPSTWRARRCEFWAEFAADPVGGKRVRGLHHQSIPCDNQPRAVPEPEIKAVFRNSLAKSMCNPLSDFGAVRAFFKQGFRALNGGEFRDGGRYIFHDARDGIHRRLLEAGPAGLQHAGTMNRHGSGNAPSRPNSGDAKPPSKSWRAK